MRGCCAADLEPRAVLSELYCDLESCFSTCPKRMNQHQGGGLKTELTGLSLCIPINENIAHEGKMQDVPKKRIKQKQTCANLYRIKCKCF